MKPWILNDTISFKKRAGKNDIVMQQGLSRKELQWNMWIYYLAFPSVNCHGLYLTVTIVEIIHEVTIRGIDSVFEQTQDGPFPCPNKNSLSQIYSKKYLPIFTIKTSSQRSMETYMPTV